ncbi:MAG TPA: alpha/beta hydrolase, partial [Bacillota bacterium]|nr:alpha/beta hydrolase [Bacillota bacterium]
MASDDVAAQRPYEPALEIQALIDLVNTLGNDLDTLTLQNVAAVRSLREERAQRFLWHIPVETVRNFTLPGEGPPVPVRLYIPHNKQLARDGKLPVVIFFHGGGWVLGSPAVYDSITRRLARQIPALVLSVEYRLAPEHPFPAAVYDADTVLRWALQHAEEIGGDPTRIVVAGDSAGGTLATVAALRVRELAGPPVAMQVLFYPSTNISSMDYASYRQYGTGHLLTRKAIESFREFYLPQARDRTLPEASPLLANDLRGMPPALIIGAGCDPLRDEGRAYAEEL